MLPAHNLQDHHEKSSGTKRVPMELISLKVYYSLTEAHCLRDQGRPNLEPI